MGRCRPVTRASHLRRVALPFAALLLAACGDPAPVRRAPPLGPEHYVIAAGDRPAAGEFIRYAAPGPGPGGLDIAVTDYEHPEGRAPVRLAGVVHVADAFYYDALQRELDECETVLFEAVMPEGKSVTDWIESQGEARSEMAGFQQQIARWMGFEWQLQGIDYSSPRFVHADMTVEEFRAKGGGELLPDLPTEGEGSASVPPALHALLEKGRALADYAMSEDNPARSLLRRSFAEALGRADLAKALEMHPGLSDLLLVKRNAVAMRKLEETLPSARGLVCVFYGAAHMEGLEDDLVGRLGYRRRDGRWHRAWALRAPLR